MLMYLIVIASVFSAHGGDLRPVDFVDQFGSPATRDAHFDELDAFMSRAHRGGTLKLSWNEAIPSVYPSVIRDGDFKPRAPNVDQFVYETLLTPDPRFESHTVFPLVAKQVLASADFCQFAVELRDDVRFSDGTPLTTSDVRRSVDAFIHEYFSGALTEFTKRLFGELHLDIQDGTHFTVRFEHLRPELCRQGAYNLLSSVPLVKPNPQPAMKDNIQMPYLGSGPYRVTTAARLQVRMNRNPDYWGNAHPLRAKTMNPDVIETLVVMDQTLERFALLRGDINLFREKAFTLDEWMASHANGKHPYQRLDQRTDALESDIGAVWMNQRRPDTGDPNFRRAMLLAWDVSIPARDFFAGRRTALTEPGQLSEFRPRGEPSPAVRALLERAGPADPEVIDALKPAGDLNYAKLTVGRDRRERLRLALDYLSRSGYKLTRLRGHTRLTKNGRPVELTAAWLLGSTESRLLIRFQTELAYLGIKLNFRVYPDRSTLVAALQADQYDFHPGSTEIARDFHVLNPNYLLWELHSRNRERLAAWGRVQSKVLDVTLDALEVTAPGTPEYRVVAESFLRAFNANMPVLLSGEVDPVLTYHAKDVRVWPNREMDLRTLYIESEMPKN